MRTQTVIEKRLRRLEAELTEQAKQCQEHGYHSHHGLFWDRRVIERRTLLYVLGRRFKPFNAADTLAGW